MRFTTSDAFHHLRCVSPPRMRFTTSDAFHHLGRVSPPRTRFTRICSTQDAFHQGRFSTWMCSTKDVFHRFLHLNPMCFFIHHIFQPRVATSFHRTSLANPPSSKICAFMLICFELKSLEFTLPSSECYLHCFSHCHLVNVAYTLFRQSLLYRRYWRYVSRNAWFISFTPDSSIWIQIVSRWNSDDRALKMLLQLHHHS